MEQADGGERQEDDAGDADGHQDRTARTAMRGEDHGRHDQPDHRERCGELQGHREPEHHPERHDDHRPWSIEHSIEQHERPCRERHRPAVATCLQ